MPGTVTVRIVVNGAEEAIAYLDRVSGALDENLFDAMSVFGRDSQVFMSEHTPRRTGLLRAGTMLASGRLSFRITNDIYYAGWRNFGHMTPRGWHTRHGYRLAKRRSFVEGAHFYEKTLEYANSEARARIAAAVEQSIE